MKITKQYLKQIILEELTAIKGGGEGTGKATGKLKSINTDGPDISFYEKGPLGPDSKKQYIKSIRDRSPEERINHIYKIAHGYGVGDYEPKKDYNGFLVISDHTLKFDREWKNKAAQGREFLFNREGGENEAMRKALNFAYTNDPNMDYTLSDEDLVAAQRAKGAAAGRRAARKRYSASREAEINAGLNEPDEGSDYY